jgi:hypothetical protein
MTIFCGSDLDRIPISNLPGMIGMTIRGPSFDPIFFYVFRISCFLKDAALRTNYTKVWLKVKSRLLLFACAFSVN